MRIDRVLLGLALGLAPGIIAEPGNPSNTYTNPFQLAATAFARSLSSSLDLTHPIRLQAPVPLTPTRRDYYSNDDPFSSSQTASQPTAAVGVLPTSNVPVAQGTALPIVNGYTVQKTILPGQTHKYVVDMSVDLNYTYNDLKRATALDAEASTHNMYATLNLCGLPPNADPSLMHDSDWPALYMSEPGAGSGSGSDSVLQGIHVSAGFANLTITNYHNASAIIVEVVAPQLPSQPASGPWSYELGVSNLYPIHEVVATQAVYLVDTDSSHALLVSGNMTDSLVAAEAQSDLKLYLFPANSSVSAYLPASYCAVQQGDYIFASDNSTAVNSTVGELGAGGPKVIYNMAELNRSQDYHVLVASGSQRTVYNPPVSMSTKSSDVCKLIQGLDFCDNVAYAVPGPGPAAAESMSVTELAQFYDSMAQTRYVNFTYSLQNVGCNQSDENRYSISRNCDDCAASYKNWLCAVTIPRCEDWDNGADYLFPRQTNTSRNPVLDNVLRPGPYKEVMPCASMCWELVQSCDPGFGFVCPQASRGLNSSYGLGVNDGIVRCNFPGVFHQKNKASRTAVSALAVGVAVFVCLCI